VGTADWNAAEIPAQRTLLDALADRGLLGWLWLGELPNLPAGSSPKAQLLAQVVDGLQGHPALGASHLIVVFYRRPWAGVTALAARHPATRFQRIHKLDRHIRS
jgi:hypothetical protein